MITLNFHTVDVFTEMPFTGNSLAIVEQADGLADAQMQTLAREFNLPETIFIQRPDQATHTAKVRIFLPRKETPSAGHPTIGCAIFIAQKIYGDKDDFETEITLEEVAGLVPVSVVRKDGAISAQLTAPVVPYEAAPIEASPSVTLDARSIAKAYGLTITDIDLNGSAPRAHAGGPTFLFIPVTSREALSGAKAIEPLCTDLPKLFGGTGGYLYYIGPNSNEVHARMFAPGAGVPEDPATGSASAILASQLRMANRLEEGTNHFDLFQGYDMGRPSQLHLEIDLTQGSIEAVRVAGTSVAISSGTISIPD
jgi:trans-2,3-dihydro-3-hydroxyanthranilate isomerase